MVMLGQFLCVPRIFFHERLRPGLRDGIISFNYSVISAISLKFDGMMHSAMKQIAI